jgi:hypothetical protein
VDLVRRGRMRQVRHLLFQQASFAASLGLGGAIVLLVLGTQILNWYWPVLLFSVSLAAGAYRARNKVLSRYQVAQSIDRQLGFHDSLSTAVYFSEHPDRVSSGQFIENQKASAEDLARSADVQRGLPFFTPRTLYVNAALAAIVCSMFGVRYGINHSLDLRPSLVRIGFDGFLGQSREVASAKRVRGPRPFDPDDQKKATAADPWEAKPEDPSATPDANLDASNEPEVSNSDVAPDASTKSKATGTEPPPPGEDPLDASDKGENSQAGSDSGDSNSPQGNSQKDNQDSAMKNSGQSGAAGEQSSLSEKMKDALANLLAKLKPGKNDGKPSSSQSQSGSQASQQKSQSSDSNSSQSQSKQQADGDTSAQSQGDQQSQNGSQSAQGKSEGKSTDKPNSPDGKSGIGKQDGDKSAREAAELAAMGKISEIIGKRAQNVSGEVMVEVASGKQTLKTQYSQRKAEHVEAGSEINRDEVPLAYQQYVQQYFEEIRKVPASKTKAKASSN